MAGSSNKTIAGSAPFPEKDYQAEDDFRTLQRADEVTSDRDRHKRALGHGKKQMKSMTRIVSGRR